MLVFLGVIHIIVAIVLILLVLIQDSKGDAMGGMLSGGGSSSLLGATGGATFLTSLTRYTAIVFAASCIALAYLSGKSSSSVVDDLPAPAQIEPTKKVETQDPAAAAAVPDQNPDSSASPAPAEESNSVKE